MPTGAWLHRFRNFGEDVYVRLRDRWTVNIEEIDAATDTVYIRDVRVDEVAEVEGILAGVLQKHHLGDSVFVLPPGSECSRAVVVLVVDENFGEKLWEVAAGHDVWIVPSDANRAAVVELREGRKEAGNEASATIWSAMIPSSTKEDWIAILDVIDLHHGVYSSDPPIDTLSVYGAVVTAGITAALAEYDYEIVKSTSLGFIAFKCDPGALT